MNWKKTITKKGLSVLAGLDDDNVSIVSAWAGTGGVDFENLYEQTNLINPIQSLPIIEDLKLENKRILRLQISNKDLQETYTLNQLGIFISVNEDDPILYYLAQDDIGDIIPAHDCAPGFLAEYIVTLIFSNELAIDVDCPEVGFITPDALDARIGSLKTELASKSDTELSDTETPQSGTKTHLRIITQVTNWTAPKPRLPDPILAKLLTESGHAVEGKALLDNGEMTELLIIPENGGR